MIEWASDWGYPIDSREISRIDPWQTIRCAEGRPNQMRHFVEDRYNRI